MTVNDTLVRLLLAELVRSWPETFPAARAHLAPAQLRAPPTDVVRDNGRAASLKAALEREAGVETGTITPIEEVPFKIGSSWFLALPTMDGGVYVCDRARERHWLTPREFLLTLAALPEPQAGK